MDLVQFNYHIQYPDHKYGLNECNKLKVIKLMNISIINLR